jgi:hypothetical protein
MEPMTSYPLNSLTLATQLFVGKINLCKKGERLQSPTSGVSRNSQARHRDFDI